MLQPTSSREYKPRRRRRVLIWPKNPSSWIVRLRMFPRKPHEMPPLRRARREQPRVLADPDKRAHRIAVKLARIAAGNAKANQPRLFGARAWDSQRMLNRGQRFIRTGMELVMPLIENRLAAWNERCEPG